MSDPKSEAPIEEMLAEIRQIMDEDATLPSYAPPEAEPQLGGGARTLEDVVRDLLRPMLRSWFDKNLRSLIEREVQAEIAREALEAGIEPFP